VIVPDRDVVISPAFQDDLTYWMTAQPRLARRILELVKDCRRDPFGGLGQPEALKHLGPDTWARRIDEQNRLVYRVARDRLTFLSARGHYT
jgi:toxin YoeB